MLKNKIIFVDGQKEQEGFDNSNGCILGYTTGHNNLVILKVFLIYKNNPSWVFVCIINLNKAGYYCIKDPHRHQIFEELSITLLLEIYFSDAGLHRWWSCWAAPLHCSVVWSRWWKDSRVSGGWYILVSLGEDRRKQMQVICKRLWQRRRLVSCTEIWRTSAGS